MCAWQWCMGQQLSAIFPERYQQHVRFSWLTLIPFGRKGSPTHRQHRSNRLFFLLEKSVQRHCYFSYWLHVHMQYCHLRSTHMPQTLADLNLAVDCSIVKSPNLNHANNSHWMVYIIFPWFMFRGLVLCVYNYCLHWSSLYGLSVQALLQTTYAMGYAMGPVIGGGLQEVSSLQLVWET